MFFCKAGKKKILPGFFLKICRIDLVNLEQSTQDFHEISIQYDRVCIIFWCNVLEIPVSEHIVLLYFLCRSPGKALQYGTQDAGAVFSLFMSVVP